MQVLSNKLGLCAVAAAACLAIAPAQADTGKLSLTGGITSIDGAAGGGITPWATIGTMGNEIGVSAAVAYLRDLSHAELAAQLQLPLGTVKTWIRHGLDQLRTCMARFA